MTKNVTLIDDGGILQVWLLAWFADCDLKLMGKDPQPLSINYRVKQSFKSIQVRVIIHIEDVNKTIYQVIQLIRPRKVEITF